MTPISFFKRLTITTPEETIALEKILEDIRSDRWKKEIMACRENPELKMELPCFTPTGIFSHRSKKGLVSYNGFQTLDIDHVSNPEELKNKCKTIPWVYAAFITPSGKGLKVIVKTDGTEADFDDTGKALNAAFQEQTGFERDKNCKDISRVHFVSWDPAAYINPEAEVFRKKTTPPQKL